MLMLRRGIRGGAGRFTGGFGRGSSSALAHCWRVSLPERRFVALQLANLFQERGIRGFPEKPRQ